jgi:ankyrin repeat protein
MPLHSAVERGSLDMIRLLINAGVDPHTVIWKKSNPLHFAASFWMY